MHEGTVRKVVHDPSRSGAESADDLFRRRSTASGAAQTVTKGGGDCYKAVVRRRAAGGRAMAYGRDPGLNDDRGAVPANDGMRLRPRRPSGGITYHWITSSA